MVKHKGAHPRSRGCAPSIMTDDRNRWLGPDDGDGRELGEHDCPEIVTG